MTREFQPESQINNQPLFEQVAAVMAVVDYNHYQTTQPYFWEFTRRVDLLRLYPRFHLKISRENGQLQSNFHLDVRLHVSRQYSRQVCEELERMIGRLEGQDQPLSEVNTSLLKTLKDLLYFDLAKSVRRTHLGPIEKQGLRKLRSHRKKEMGLSRKKLLKQRYAPDDLNQLIGE